MFVLFKLTKKNIYSGKRKHGVTVYFHLFIKIFILRTLILNFKSINSKKFMTVLFKNNELVYNDYYCQLSTIHIFLSLPQLTLYTVGN